MSPSATAGGGGLPKAGHLPLDPSGFGGTVAVVREFTGQNEDVMYTGDWFRPVSTEAIVTPEPGRAVVCAPGAWAGLAGDG